jgi:hypothetical protein
MSERLSENPKNTQSNVLGDERSNRVADLTALSVVPSQEHEIVLKRLEASRLSDRDNPILKRMGEHTGSRMKHPGCDGESLGVSLQSAVGAAVAISCAQLLRKVQQSFTLTQ